MVQKSSVFLFAFVALCAVTPVVAHRDHPSLEVHYKKPDHPHRVHMVGHVVGHGHRYSHRYGYGHHNHHNLLRPHRQRKKGHPHHHFHKFKNGELGYHHVYGYRKHHWPHHGSHAPSSARVHRWHAWASSNKPGHLNQHALYPPKANNKGTAIHDHQPSKGSSGTPPAKREMLWEALEDLD